MKMIFIDRALAHQVYDILVKHCGAVEGGRSMFAYHQSRGSVEYRFIGGLGLGGKFWNNNDKLYVTCYPEDETLEHQAMIVKANQELDLLTKGLSSWRFMDDVLTD